MRYQIGMTLIALGLAGPVHAKATAYSANQLTLTTAGAEKVLQTAAAIATTRNAPSDLAIVDRAGDLLAFERMDGAWLAGVPLSIGKARSAARYQHPTLALEQMIDNGRTAAITAGTVEMQGGVPIIINGVVVGAIGVSGFDKNNDIAIADTASKLQ